RDRHPQVAGRPAPRHPGSVPGRGGDARHGGGRGGRRRGHRLGGRGGRADAAPRRGRALVDSGRRRPGRRRRRGRRGVPREPRRATRSDRRPTARDVTAAFEGVAIALDSLRGNKRRAAVTILGVAIGVTVIMVMAGMISGSNQSVSNVIESIAPRRFLVWRFFQAGVNVSDGSDESNPGRRNPEIVAVEADRIALLPSVRYVTRRDESSATVEYGDRRLESVDVSGLSAQWVEVNGGDVHPGRTFTRLEDVANDAVAVINTKLEEQLFRGRDPIGQTIHVAGASFKVIGVYVPPPNLFSGATPPFVGVPYGAFVKDVPYRKGWMRLAVAPAPAYSQEDALDEVVATLRSLRRLKPGQQNNLSIVTHDKMLDTWNNVTGMFFHVITVPSSSLTSPASDSACIPPIRRRDWIRWRR